MATEVLVGYYNYFVFGVTASPIHSGIRSWDGSSWTDMTFDLNTAANMERPILWDMMFINGELLAIVRDEAAGPTALMALVSDHWVIRQLFVPGIGPEWTAENPHASYSCFVCIEGETYIHGEAGFINANGGFEFGLGVWRMQGGLPRPFAFDPDVLSFSLGRRTSVIYDQGSKRLLLSNLHLDSWGSLQMESRTFHMADNYGGSCVFSLGIDNDGVVWSGDYGLLYYRSLDGGLNYHPAEADRTRLPEVWEFLRWNNQLWGVGCNPCSVIHRNSNNGRTTGLAEAWDVAAVLDPAIDPHRDGLGFQCAEPASSDTLIIGFGGEPYYYTQNASPHSTVYSYSAGVLTDIGQGLDWGYGAHIAISPNRRCSAGVLGGSAGSSGVRFDPINEPSGDRMLAVNNNG